MILFFSKSSHGLWSLVREALCSPPFLNCYIKSSLHRQDCSRVTYIGSIYQIIYYHYGACAGPWLLLYDCLVLLHELLFSLLESLLEAQLRITREGVLLSHEHMQIISQIFCTYWTTMAIKDCKERNLLALLSNSRLLQIEHYRNPVFVIMSCNSIVSVRCICLDYSPWLGWDLWGLYGWQICTTHSFHTICRLIYRWLYRRPIGGT